MKLKIEKDRPDHLRIELVTDTAKRPTALEVTDAQVDTLIALLQTARRVDTFRFQLEL